MGIHDEVYIGDCHTKDSRHCSALNANRKPLLVDWGKYFHSNPPRLVGRGDGTEVEDQDKGAVWSEDGGNKSFGVVDGYVDEERAGYASSASGGVQSEIQGIHLCSGSRDGEACPRSSRETDVEVPLRRPAMARCDSRESGKLISGGPLARR